VREIQIIIAEFEGWKKARCCGVRFERGDEGLMDLPDYLHDLNACHEMIKQLTQKQVVRYIDWLLELAGDNHGGMSEATAAQRCKAFVLTMTKGV